MTTYPEHPDPPTVEQEHLPSADAHVSNDTWVGDTPHEKVPREPVVVVFMRGEKSHTGRRQ